ncbi:MAG: cutinase family protein [Mycobacterium sp.]
MGFNSGSRPREARIEEAVTISSTHRGSPTTSAAVRRIRVAIAAALSALALTALAGLGAPTAAAIPKCNDVEVVFARGTTEPAGLGAVGKALINTLRPMMKGQSVGAYAVKYPASWDFTQVATGANDASKRIQSIAATCPNSKIVLGGYSQGAAVIDVVTTSPIAGLGYTEPLPAAVVPHIAAVAVFGNPSARLGRPLTSLSPDFGPRTADLCNTNDPICSTGKDLEAHSRYPQSGLVKLAAQWVTKQVRQSERSTANS